MDPELDLAGRRIVVGVCGGIAAYKAVEVARLSPDSIDSMSHDCGASGMSCSSFSQITWVASVTMFWPAASPVENSNST